MLRATVGIFAVFFVFTLTLMAAGPAIGFVSASGGDFRLNDAATRGTGTLFDGSVLETSAMRSDVSLASGAYLVLSPHSKTRIYKDHAVVESGALQASAPGYTLIAGKLSITGSGAQVAVDSPTKVRVEALSSPVEIRNANHVLIARVNPGTAREFENQAGGASAAVTVTGPVSKEGDNYFITDKATSVKYQLQGPGLSRMVGRIATVKGSLVPNATPAGDATGLIAVSSSERGAAAAGAVAGGAGAAGAAGAGAGAGAGLSTAAIAGIAVGVAAGGVVGGLAAAGTFSSASAQ